MIWINDFQLLEPDYLRTEFQPADSHVAPVRVGYALACADPKVADYMLRNINTVLRQEAEKGLNEAITMDSAVLHSAAIELVGVYFWELVYRKLPSAYDAFSQAQHCAWDRLWPAESYRNDDVLDIGCGTGALSRHLATSVRRLYAVDRVPAMLELCREKLSGHPNTEVLTGKFQSIPLAEASVGAVVSNLAFQHHDYSGGKRGLEELRRVVRPGGRIRITVGNVSTQDFLLHNGFDEEFVPHGLVFRLPEAASVAERCMYELATRTLLRDLPTGANKHRHHMSADRAKLRWIASNVGAAASGTPWKMLFYRGSVRAPLGIRIYTWRKSTV